MEMAYKRISSSEVRGAAPAGYNDWQVGVDFYPISFAAETSAASNDWDTSGRLSSSLAHLDPQGPQTWRVLRAHHGPLDSDRSKAHDFGSGTVLRTRA